MEDSPVRISVVSYLNSTPFIYGLRKTGAGLNARVSLDIPSVCAAKLQSGDADIGLVPVAVLPFLSSYRIISDYCIGSDGDVASVLLLSDCPVEEVKTILLDYQSRTSVMLTRLLADRHWKINPEWKSTSEGYENNISGNTAAVVIGDRALLLKKNFRYVYDLSTEWKNLTGLPFVFACWVAVKDPGEEFTGKFNAALSSGLSSIREVSDDKKSQHFSGDEIYFYLTQNIQYSFDEKKKEALSKFLSMIRIYQQ